MPPLTKSVYQSAIQKTVTQFTVLKIFSQKFCRLGVTSLQKSVIDRAGTCGCSWRPPISGFSPRALCQAPPPLCQLGLAALHNPFALCEVGELTADCIMLNRALAHRCAAVRYCVTLSAISNYVTWHGSCFQHYGKSRTPFDITTESRACVPRSPRKRLKRSRLENPNRINSLRC